MTEPKRIRMISIVIIAIFAAAVFFNETKADDGHGHNHHDDGDVIGDTILTGGDNTASNTASISGSRSIGIGGSDYDIGQCMYHSGGLTFAIGFRNKFCEGMDMIRSGMVDAGVLHICKQTKIGRNYDSLEDCKAGLVISYGEMTTNDTEKTENDKSVTESDDEEDEHTNDISVLYALFSDLEAQRNEDKADAEKAVERANAAAHRANQAEIDRKAYAQQTLEAYREAINE